MKKQTITVVLPEHHYGLTPGNWNPSTVRILDTQPPVELPDRYKYTITVWIDSPGPGQLTTTVDSMQQKVVSWLHGASHDPPFVDPYGRNISVQISKMLDN